MGSPPWSDAVLAAKWLETLNYYKVDGPRPRNAPVRWFGRLAFEPTRSLFLRSWTLARFDGPVVLTSDTPVLPLHKDGFPTEIKSPAAADLVVVPLTEHRLTVKGLVTSSAKIGAEVQQPRIVIPSE